MIVAMDSRPPEPPFVEVERVRPGTTRGGRRRPSTASSAGVVLSPDPAFWQISQFCGRSQSRASEIAVFSGLLRWRRICACTAPEMLKIQRSVHAGNVRIVLSGRIEGEHLAELQRLIDEDAPHERVTLDLEDVRLVDREAVGFLARCEERGIRLENYCTYVCEWIPREKNEPANPPRRRRR